MKKNISHLFFIISLCFILIMMLFHADWVIAGAHTGLQLWYTSVLPSIFPFMIITTLLLNHIQGSNICALGLVCGLPVGANLVNQQYKAGAMNARTANILLCICNITSPMFICGYIWNQTFEKQISLFYFLLLVYIPMAVYGCIFYFFVNLKRKCFHKQSSTPKNRFHSDSNTDTNSDIYTDTDTKRKANTKADTIANTEVGTKTNAKAGTKANTEVATKANAKTGTKAGTGITSKLNNFPTTESRQKMSLESILLHCLKIIFLVGIYIMLFCIFIQFALELIPPHWIHTKIAASFLEITNGIRLIQQLSLPMQQKTALIAGLTSFGGICSIFQTKSVLTESELSIMHYTITKILLGIVSYLLGILIPMP